MYTESPVARPIESYDRAGLQLLLGELGQPRYRVRQLLHWLYQREVDAYAEMTDLPADLRAELAERAPIARASVRDTQVSVDGTRKYLVEFHDGTVVETVGLPTADRLTVCFSTQAGCAMRCSFCATGAAGLVRSLTPGEMVEQVMLVATDFAMRVSNAVAMGQGEPFADYDATLGGLRLLNDPDALGIGARHITLSTCGIIPAIRRFAEEPEQFTLAVSLHSAVQATRDQLMPGVAGMPLDELRAALHDYAERTGRRPSLEYALIEGVNDTDAQLDALVAFCQGQLVHVNLIPVNPVTEAGYERAAKARITAFMEALARAGVEASVRAERGADIDAACGQLRQRVPR